MTPPPLATRSVVAIAALLLATTATAAPAPAPAPSSAASREPPISVRGCPSVIAGEPPIKFGAAELVPLCRDLYVEPALTPPERERVAMAYSAARDDVARHLGPLQSAPPLAILCKTDECRDYFGGTAHRSWTLARGERLPGATHVAGRLTILILRIDEKVRGVIAHETVHAEVSYRLRRAHLPTWFHEGLAAIVGDEPRCEPGGARGVDDLRRLDQNAAWADYTNTSGTIHATYCQARAEVERWLAGSGGQGTLELIRRVRDGARFEDVYGPLLTQDAGAIPTVLVTSAPSLGDGGKPFSLTMWIKPRASAGVLAHVSDTSVGTGWCTPFLGYDRAQHLVAQVLHGDSGEPSSYAVVTDGASRPVGAWTHVAMTWAPGGAVKLYVSGALVGEVRAPRYHARGAGPPMYVAWGGSNIGGATCWQGAIAPGSFTGAVTSPRVHDAELTAAEIAALARDPP